MSESDEELVDVGPDPDETDELLHEPEEVLAGADSGDLAAERDEYLEALRRVKAEFENHKKRAARDRELVGQQVASGLLTALLPALDSCDAAIAQGSEDVEPIRRSLIEALGKEGLEVVHPDGEPFDPNIHEAMMHEEADDGSAESVVVETLRTGYLWQGQVVRPAMVKVRG